MTSPVPEERRQRGALRDDEQQPMITHHPQLDLLTEHAAGVLPLAQGACIAAHLNYCDSCARSVAQLQQVGAAHFNAADGEPVGDAMLDRVLARLDEEPPLQYEAHRHDAKQETDAAPALLQRLMQGDFSDLPWRRVTDALRTTLIRTGDPQFEFSLLHIAAGGEIPAHDHRGQEMTLVLQGGFSDQNGSYHPGDFIFRQPGDQHAPRAFEGEDCICLAVVDQPLRFTGWKHRWMNPFLSLQAG
jgi:putative transcriptional regulator